jgi:hypothetical protein
MYLCIYGKKHYILLKSNKYHFHIITSGNQNLRNTNNGNCGIKLFFEFIFPFLFVARSAIFSTKQQRGMSLIFHTIPHRGCTTRVSRTWVPLARASQLEIAIGSNIQLLSLKNTQREVLEAFFQRNISNS